MTTTGKSRLSEPSLFDGLVEDQSPSDEHGERAPDQRDAEEGAPDRAGGRGLGQGQGARESTSDPAVGDRLRPEPGVTEAKKEIEIMTTATGEDESVETTSDRSGMGEGARPEPERSAGTEATSEAPADRGAEGELQDAHEEAEALGLDLGDVKKALGRIERALKPLSLTWRDPQVIEKNVEAIRSELDDLFEDLVVRAGVTGETSWGEVLSERLESLVAAGDRWLEAERQGRRGRLARTLKAATAKKGIPLRVVTREPLVLRLPPVGVELDLEKGRATIVFGRQELVQCAAEAEEILAARDKALAMLERKGWTPEGFHRELRRAWGLATKITSRGDGWVELADLLPILAMTIQPDRWRHDPRGRHFIDYGKAHFLYEIHRLREAEGLLQEGWRLALGPATGNTTRNKKRVFWVEDGEGRGAYHLTLRFVPVEGWTSANADREGVEQ